uniref:Uncharacterized protein n=1 Tax=Physcomitrium patens TaxID=3218 RepID=A0A7I4AUN7_PHYPA
MYCGLVAVTSKSEACESSKGVFKPEAVPNTRISLQDPANASQITDLVPQNRPNLLISQYEIEKNLHDLSDKDCATVDSTTQVTNSDTSNMGYDGIESKQVLPRTQNAVSFSVVSARIWFRLRVRVMKEVVTMKMPLKCILTKTSDLEDDKWVSQEPVRSVGESRESEAWQKVFMLRSKLTSFFHKPVEESMARPRRDSGVVFDIMAKQRESEELSHCFEQEKDLLSADSEAEIARLTSLLHVKNLEYRKASRELEETKAVLSLVRAKQSADMAQAKLMAVEKDLRLQAAEQAVDSLKLVQSNLPKYSFQVESQVLLLSRNTKTGKTES